MNYRKTHPSLSLFLTGIMLVAMMTFGGGQLMAQTGVVVNGDVYGGGNDANVTEDANVTIVGGRVEGNVYGGGRGTTTAVYVNGNVAVNIGEDAGGGTATGNASFGHVDAVNGTITGGNIFGCNNLQGCPKGNVTIDIWKTAHTSSPAATTNPIITPAGDQVGSWDNMDEFYPYAATQDAHSPLRFAIQGAYGGGNEANYEPDAGKSTTVTIHYCDNTVKMVYGGGRAADVGKNGVVSVNTNVVVEGGRIDTLFAGGDGHTKDGLGNYRPANIYGGTVDAAIHGGYFTAAFAASNTRGEIHGTKSMSIDKTGSCAMVQEELIAALFGGSNLADLTEDVTLEVMCGAGAFYDVYGGCNLANITGNVTVNIWGGTIYNVYGGSRGTAEKAADISGNVTVNIYGGNLGNVFGGSNVNGNIGGKIEVNVDWKYAGDHANACDEEKEIDNIYGGSNMATYTPNAAYRADGVYTPLVNLIRGHVGRHTALGSEHPVFDPIHFGPHAHVFGGGKGVINATNPGLAGKVTANPKVIMNSAVDQDFDHTTHDGFTVLSAIYGGGELAIVDGTTYVEINAGHVGCEHTTEIDAVSGERLNLLHDDGFVFGGGSGSDADPRYAGVTKNTYVTMSGGYVHNSLFGGGELASVGTFARADAPNAAKDIIVDEPTSCTSGTGISHITISGGKIGPVNVTMRADLGYVFGASQGVYTQPAAAYTADDVYHDDDDDPLVNAKFGYVDSTEVLITDNAFIVGAVWGGSENGQVLRNCHVTIAGGQIGVGEGMDRPYTTEEWATARTAVTVTKTPAAINAAAALFSECNSWDYGYTNPSTGKTNYLPYDPYIDITHHTDASTDHPADGHTFFGNVFGGGSGYYPYVIIEATDGSGNVTSAHNKWYPFQGRVRGNTRVDVTGGHILTSLYGGCEYADVIGSCTVNFGTDNGSGNPTLGVPRTIEQTLNHPVTCYLFGAGKGDQRTTFNMRTNVDSVVVNIGGGSNHPIIYGSVFGGGEDGHVTRNAQVNIGQNAWIGTWGTSYVDGNIFGGGRGFGGTSLAAGSLGGNVTINISGNCNILGSVYGGGRLASVGIHLVDETDPRYGLLQGDFKNPVTIGTTTYPADAVDINEHGNIVINITGGTIGSTIEFAPADFDPASSYLKDDIVLYNNNIWRFNKAHSGDWDDDDASEIEHTTGGNVFGGSMGRLLNIGETNYSDPNSFNHLWPGLAKCRSTDVKITGTARIYGDVYGGGELGYVMKHAEVDVGVNGGSPEIGYRIGAFPDIRYTGSVYGGGYGSSNATIHTNDSASTSGSVTAAMHAGRVYGNTDVDMEGGQVWGNIYGGGEMASVGRRWINMTDNNFGDNFLPYVGYANKTYTVGTKEFTCYGYSENVCNTFVKVKGGTVGDFTNTTIGTHRNAGWIAGKTGGVFGGGKGHPGLVGYDDFHYTRMAYVDSAKIEITGGYMAVIFGGGENGHVRYGTKITMSGGVVGLPLQPQEIETDIYGYSPVVGYIGNVYGGGRGVELTKEGVLGSAAGQVYRNTNVEITGGTVYHNVYGGGSLATVGRPTATDNPILLDGTGNAYVTIKGNAVIGDEYVNGLNSGRVFGSGRGVAGADYASRAYTNNTFVTIGDDGSQTCHVYGSVFGSGENGHVENHTHVYIKPGCIIGENWSSLPAEFKNFVGNVYGGGRGVDVDDGQISRTAGLVHGSTHITVTGGEIFHNIYGGGSLASIGDTAEVTGYSTFKDTVEYTYQHAAYTAAAFDAATNNGHAYIYVSGGKIGLDGNDNGCVFGGGRGNAGLSNEWYMSAPIPSPELSGFTHGTVDMGGTTYDLWYYTTGSGANAKVITYRVSNKNELGFLNSEVVWVRGKNRRNTSEQYEDSLIWRDYTNHTYVTGSHVLIDYPNVPSYYTKYPDNRNTTYDEAVFAANLANTVNNTSNFEYIRGAVYGGGDNGHVRGNTEVVINNGRIGTLTYDGIGDVYGGGSGVGLSFDGKYSEYAGKVYGNTNLTINDGWILHNVYGGGSMSSVGDFIPYLDMNNSPGSIESTDKDIWLHGQGQVVGYTISGGTCNVTINGGRIGELNNDIMNGSDIREGMDGVNRNLGGCVFGSSRGQSSDEALVNRMAYVNNTNVYINDGTITGSVFGGGANGHVFYTAKVYIDGGTIGVPNTTTTGSIYRGNAYAAGRGIDPVSSTHAFNRNSGLILGNTYLTMTDGTVYHNVYGGGSLATVGTYTYIENNDDGKQDSILALQRPETGKTEVTITGGTVGINGINNGNVFGAGRGYPGYYNTISGVQSLDRHTFVSRTYVTIGGTAEIMGSVFGSGDNGHVLDSTQVVICGGTIGDGSYGSTIGNVFGSGRGADTYNIGSGYKLSPNAGRVYGNANVYIVDGKIKNNVYGGGYLATVDGNTNVTIANTITVRRENWVPDPDNGVPTNTPVSTTYNTSNSTAYPQVWGDVFGGSALGELGNADGFTTLNILGGFIGDNSGYNDGSKGNIFGGGNGDGEGATMNGVIPSGKRAANVHNAVQVNIGNSSQYHDNSKGATIYGSVFGGNNVMGSPKGTIRVDVYSTAHTTANEFAALKRMHADVNAADFDDLEEVSHITDPDALSAMYALSAVYGGGNKATVEPTASSSTTTVYIHECDENTIEYVYGGGNAADLGNSSKTVSTNVVIEGGHIYRAFGGGNGYSSTNNHTNPNAANYNPGADVYGDASIEIKGGSIYQTFGGSNSMGMIHGTSSVDIAETPTCETHLFSEVYGGGNEATGGNIEVTLPCQNNIYIPLFIAGSNNADIGTPNDRKHVHLIVNGGNYGQIFGGNNQGGTIFGDITVDVHGGNIGELFGENNEGGNVVGNIVVNIDSTNTGCPLNIDYVYGGGNQANYCPDSTGTGSSRIATTSETRISPIVNVLCGTVNRAVFGGSKGDISGLTTVDLKANPQVIIGSTKYDHVLIGNPNKFSNAPDHPVTPITGDVFGGGNAAPVEGNTTVIIKGANTKVLNNTYGGGNQAPVSGDTKVQIGG